MIADDLVRALDRKPHTGADSSAGEMLQVIISHGAWFGATVERGDYVLVGCAVSPGFDVADFEIRDRSELLRLYPQADAMTERLCRA